MDIIRQRVACKAVIRHGSKILILREAATNKDGTNVGRYQLPGGRIEPGEPYIDGLNREVMEETGLQVEVGKPIAVGEWFPVIRGEKNQIVAIFFDCNTDSTAVTLSDEHDEYRWIEASEYSTYNLLDSESAVFKAYIESIAG
jgi:8-oxo-dGTP diphosphatase